MGFWKGAGALVHRLIEMCLQPLRWNRYSTAAIGILVLKCTYREAMSCSDGFFMPPTVTLLLQLVM